ncbi:SWIM zinc finger family protein [Brevibacillus sp. SYSU BS000544]|uniref:SWIM zinc finger family protein n=1 Tax=Brevibacillus sp. SYSU BS000544 TaxID=3416443 RepID=UPI003CE4D9AA
MLQRQLTREQVTKTGEQILVNMKDYMIERGYQYFSDGRVFNIQVLDSTLLTSNVQGEQVYHVTIHLEYFPKSTCTCPYAQFCKHIAATFFQAYSVFENPRNFLQAAQQPRKPSFSPSMLYPTYKKMVGEQERKPLFIQGVTITENSSVSDWYRFLTNWSRNLLTAMEINRASTELYNSYQQVLGATQSWTEDAGQLFTIHANLFHLGILQEYVQRKHSSYWLQDLAQTANNLVEQLEAILFYMDKTNVKERLHGHLEETLQKTKELKLCDPTSKAMLQAYRILWWELFRDSDWIHTETSELEQLIKRPDNTPAENSKYQMLRAHFFVMEGKDEEALSVFTQCQGLSLTFYLLYIKAFARNSDWTRVLFWVDRLDSVIGTADTTEYKLVIAIWQHAMELTGQRDECGPKLQRFLPQSFHDYAAYLIEQKQFKLWLDLQMSLQVNSADVNSHTVKDLEEANPALLLPFYIREVNLLVSQRNRTAYRDAAKLLKKVRLCFVKANQEEKWDQFILRLAAKHYRLRAFQEELKRGNLYS